MFKNFSTSKTEIIDITKAWIVISIAFAIVLRRIINVSDNLIYNFLFSFILSAVTVGIGFLFHELSHKVIAQRYGAIAEFRAFDYMLVLALALALIGSPIVFAAPGAVMIAGGRINIKRNGLISVAGPMTNLILALLFFIVKILDLSSAISLIGQYGFFINAWLALFNMIPFGPFDGRKVFVWNKAVWISVVLIAVVFLFVLR